MKEYKVMTAKAESKTEQQPGVKAFFFGGGSALTASEIAANAEKLMQQMSRDGWEVLSIIHAPLYQQTGELLITFERYV